MRSEPTFEYLGENRIKLYGYPTYEIEFKVACEHDPNGETIPSSCFDSFMDCVWTRPNRTEKPSIACEGQLIIGHTPVNELYTKREIKDNGTRKMERYISFRYGLGRMDVKINGWVIPAIYLYSIIHKILPLYQGTTLISILIRTRRYKARTKTDDGRVFSIVHGWPHASLRF